MGSIPLNHLLKIGAAALQTTAQTLSDAINELKTDLLDAVDTLETSIASVAGDIPTISVGHTGTASGSAVRKQQITVDSTTVDIDGTAYMEQTISAQANTDITFTFTNAALTYASVLDIFAGCKTADYAIPTLKSKTLSVSGGTGTLTLVYNVPTAYALTVRVYIRG